MLQPLVENAILHGLADRDNGSIVLSVSEQPGSLLRIAVSDDGSGIPDEVIRRFAQDGPAREGRLGLYNVNLILKKYYGTDFGLHLRNNPEGGATVYALLPITRRETDA
ncbi:MAG: sensor histidine kinase [Christensenellales bacterium]